MSKVLVREWSEFVGYYDQDIGSIIIDVDGVIYLFSPHHVIELIQELSTALVEYNGGPRP